MSTIQETITAKIVAKVSFTLDGPLLIGSGSDEHSDKDQLTDHKERAYIPASSLVGSLKSFCEAYHIVGVSLDDDFFWGSSNDKGTSYKSHFMPEGFYPLDDVNVNIRDGIKIDPDKGIVKTGGKYDYQVVEANDTTFHAFFFVDVRKGMDVAEITKTTQALCSALDRKEFRLGAHTNHGFGKLKNVDYKLWSFSFENDTTDAGHWFTFISKLNKHKERNQQYYQTEPELAALENQPFTWQPKYGCFTLQIGLKLKNGFIIGAGSTVSKNGLDADKVHLQHNGRNIVSGKSFRGALRNQARRIIAKADFSNVDLENMFGDVDESNQKSKAQKGRLRTEESIFEQEVEPQMQQRIRIDRFTGGTQKGALFNSKPLQKSKTEEADITLCLSLHKPTKDEALILLHLAKDLCTGHLAIGGEKNIGRGVFKGLSVNATYEGSETETHQFTWGENSANSKKAFDNILAALPETNENKQDGNE